MERLDGEEKKQRSFAGDVSRHGGSERERERNYRRDDRLVPRIRVWKLVFITIC